MMTDTKHEECLANLSEVKGWKPSSRVTGRGQRDALELPTAAEATVFRGGVAVALCLGPRGLAHCQNYRVEKRTGIKVSAFPPNVCAKEHTQEVSSSNTEEASHADAKLGVGLHGCLEWIRGDAPADTCWFCSTEKSHD